MNSFQPVQTSQMPIKEKIINLLWGIINTTLFRFTPPYLLIFRKLRIFLLRCFGAKVSYMASIHPSVRINYPWRLTMGANSSIGEKSWVYCLDEIAIGEKTCVGKEVYLLTGTHDISSKNFDLVTKPIHIGNGVWIATSSTILPGVNLSDMTVVGAGSVVTKSTEENDVVGGNPARFIKKRVLRE